MTTAVEITLPFPPSTNNMFATVRRRRIIAPRYAKWRRHAEQMILISGAPEFKERVNVTITLYPPDRRERDADNHVKGVLDSLTRMRVIADDSGSYVKSTKAEWAERRPGGLAVVRIEPAA